MPRRAKSFFNRQGLLLVEATLTAAVLAVGLIFISQGLRASVKALKTIQRSDTMVQLAEGVLRELEAHGSALSTITKTPEGTFPEPHGAYGWKIQTRPLAGEPSLTEVHVLISHESNPDATLKLATVFPTDWIPASWQ